MSLAPQNTVILPLRSMVDTRLGHLVRVDRVRCSGDVHGERDARSASALELTPALLPAAHALDTIQHSRTPVDGMVCPLTVVSPPDIALTRRMSMGSMPICSATWSSAHSKPKRGWTEP